MNFDEIIEQIVDFYDPRWVLTEKGEEALEEE